MDTLTIGIIIWMFLPIPLAILWFLARKKVRKSSSELDVLREKFKPILHIEEEVLSLRSEADEVIKKTEEVRTTYKEKRLLLDQLQQQVAIYDEQLSFSELGLYEPHFEFNDSEQFKTNIKQVREQQKAMVSNKNATRCPNEWTVDGSRSKGQTMINRQTRLTMRAFNNECEAAIANTRWNNVVAMEKRILNAAKQINSANSSMNLEINEDYIALKIDELHLTHEYREQIKLEKDERSELARLEREEKKLLQEAERAEKEEQKFQELLDRTRAEVGVDENRIKELEAALEKAHESSQRARAMAEMTKSGYVYIISNIGSFGEDIVKIGLTRRLEPDDRVRELGDASVPFKFDTHAMIYSDEAPALETALHKEFADQRINKSNMRKEFFNVALDQVEEAVSRLAPESNFFKDREAQEWHETLALRKQKLTSNSDIKDNFPKEI